MPQKFSYWQTDVASLLPGSWQEDIGAVARAADFRAFPRTPILSREAPDVTHIERGRVNADTVMRRLPWLYKLYRNEFLELAAEARGEHIDAACDDRYGVVLNVQRGKTMRFECHVDSNPVTGILFFTDHPAGGGELVVSQDPDAVGVDELERDCTPIPPAAGQIIIFDGKNYPHYARSLPGEQDIRVVAVMNFYTGSCPESARPPELNRHRFGDALFLSEPLVQPGREPAALAGTPPRSR
jgi:hypothetical protein